MLDSGQDLVVDGIQDMACGQGCVRSQLEDLADLIGAMVVIVNDVPE